MQGPSPVFPLYLSTLQGVQAAPAVSRSCPAVQAAERKTHAVLNSFYARTFCRTAGATWAVRFCFLESERINRIQCMFECKCSEHENGGRNLLCSNKLCWVYLDQLLNVMLKTCRDLFLEMRGEGNRRRGRNHTDVGWMVDHISVVLHMCAKANVMPDSPYPCTGFALFAPAIQSYWLLGKTAFACSGDICREQARPFP